MPRRLSRQRIEKIQRRVAAHIANPPPLPELVLKRLACGHDGLVVPGTNPELAWSQACRVNMQCFGGRDAE